MNPTRTKATRWRSNRLLTVAAATVMAIGATACDGTAANQSIASTPASASTPTEAWTPTPTPTSTPSPTPTTPSATPITDVSVEASVLSDGEVAGLLWMREEEQLAHDVYVALGELWGLRIFENIAASESTHIEAVSRLLDLYGIDDPAQGNEPDTFTDPAIQTLYDQLVADGSVSLEAALAVGALIEELDISDLRERSAGTDVAEITTVYATLERGSRNHLRAFTSQLDSRGVSYEPTQLDPASFDAIVSSEMERGRDG